MYCVKCGVKLAEGVKTCPLCATPVWCPDEAGEKEERTSYSRRYPVISRQERLTAMAALTAVLLAAMLACLSICLNMTGRVGWSFYVIVGTAAFYFAFLLPLWFRKPHPMVFVPVSFASVCLLLLLLSGYTGGHWFLTFAFPLTLLLAALTIGALALYRYVKKGTLFITGGLLMACGGACLLAEFFEHLTFGTDMFTWSVYAAVVFFLFGGFFILAGMIQPLKEHLQRKFFI